MMLSSKVPPELYYEILKYYPIKQQELTFLWITGRQVSRHFKFAVELVFVKRHLPKTYLEIKDVSIKYFSGFFEFSRIDENNRALAVFVDKRCKDQERPNLVERIKSAFEDGDGPHGYDFQEPQINIQIRREVNDMPLPGFEPDWNNLVIRFDWKHMFSAFFREEREFRRRVEAREAEVLEIQSMVDRGELEGMEGFWRILRVSGLGPSHDKARREVRVDRIRKNICDSSGTEWTREIDDFEDFESEDSESEESDLGYIHLKQARNFALIDEYSDDEGGPGQRRR
ncbi:hypothetical protein BDP27DRAFT_1449014 [Rhodocollybia butyracea]|uniref:Uncharacterized protein n=1 Tax=Rhodocollybia butyracea TaxID=206335 RepID=A0A9P5PQH2_9AGAR|nr:hypothetical protein BDP27DRAFT_1449014 [Rhodocollybia butyracea]